MTAEFKINDILVALKLCADNGIDRVELQFDKNGILVMHGENKHIIRPRVIPERIIDNDITGSLEKEIIARNKPKLSFKSRVKGLLGG